MQNVTQRIAPGSGERKRSAFHRNARRHDYVHVRWRYADLLRQRCPRVRPRDKCFHGERPIEPARRRPHEARCDGDGVASARYGHSGIWPLRYAISSISQHRPREGTHIRDPAALSRGRQHTLPAPWRCRVTRDNRIFASIPLAFDQVGQTLSDLGRERKEMP